MQCSVIEQVEHHLAEQAAKYWPNSNISIRLKKCSDPRKTQAEATQIEMQMLAVVMEINRYNNHQDMPKNSASGLALRNNS